MKKVYCIVVLLIKKLEYWNQGIHTGWLIRGGAYMRGAYTWSKTRSKTVNDKDKNKNQLSQNGASRRPPPPRPIYARFINEADKDYILRQAPRILKDNPYGPTQAKVIITDDVSAKVSADRKLLREKELPEIRKRPGVKVAFIPYMIPARIQYKQDDQWKFYFLPN